MKTVLPLFSGFYNSEFDAYFNQEIEQVMDSENKTFDEISENYDIRKGQRAMAKAIVSVFNQETEIDLKFVEVWSPREYNFTNDKIICEIHEEDMKKIHAKILGSGKGRAALYKVIRKFFTQWPGFIPFYSNELEDWNKCWEEAKPEMEKDEVICQVFLTAWCALEDIEEDIFEDRAVIYESAQQIWV